MCRQSCVQAEKGLMESGPLKNETSVHLPQREAERGWSNLGAPLQTMRPAVHLSKVSATREAPYRWGTGNGIRVRGRWTSSDQSLRMFLHVISSFRSPESVEMDEIMAAMVLTSLSCSPVVQSPPQTDPGPGLSHLTNTQLYSFINFKPFRKGDLLWYFLFSLQQWTDVLQVLSANL